jgi:hypothetical protein
MRIRLLALDVDGTLLTSRREISPATRAAIQSVAASGIHVVLASARSPRALRPILAALNVGGYVIAFSGGLICRLSHAPTIPRGVVTERRISLASARAVVSRALALGLSLGWFVGETWYIQSWDATLRQEAEILGIPPITSVPLDSVAEAPHKLQCMIGDSKQALELHRLRDELPYDCAGQFSHPTYLEIVPRGVDKATGLQQLGRQLGIDRREMAAMGDGENDIAMLQEVGLGIAMGHAPASVTGAAAWVTASNDEDGVAAAVERMRREGHL